MATFGELRIVASQDIGQLGPKEGDAVTYNWKWYYNVCRLLLWLVLIVVLVFVKANRNPRAWLILIPLLIVNLLWTILKKAIPFPSSAIPMFDQLFVSLTIGIAVLWLLGHKLGNRNRFVTFLLAFAIMAVAGLAGAISYGMADFSEQTAAVLMLLAVLAFTILLGFVLTGWRCKNRYSSLRFMLWLALWCVATCVVSTLAFYSIMFAIYQPSISIFRILLQFLLMGSIFGLCAYVIILPYMILAFRSSFFRERFYACLRLKSMPTTTKQADTDQLTEQNPNPETSENSGSV